MVLYDSYGRPLFNLRIALTRRCNLRCEYCHMEGEERTRESSTEMTVDEVVRIVKIAVELGISKVKLTGGEPLMRKDVLEVVKGIAATPGLADLSMTTNGVLLASLAKDLHANGLKRLNISLPTLKAEVFRKLTGGSLEAVLGGVKAAVQVGFYPVKLNMLVLNHVNDGEDFRQMLDFARESRAILQLIELEPVNISGTYYTASYKALDEYENWLKQKALKTETRRFMQNRCIYHLPDVKAEVIHPTENAGFCMHCTRLRVTSNGRLKVCLMRNDDAVDILKPMRDGASNQELVELFRLANQKRQPYNKN